MDEFKTYLILQFAFSIVGIILFRHMYHSKPRRNAGYIMFFYLAFACVPSLISYLNYSDFYYLLPPIVTGAMASLFFWFWVVMESLVRYFKTRSRMDLGKDLSLSLLLLLLPVAAVLFFSLVPLGKIGG